MDMLVLLRRAAVRLLHKFVTVRNVFCRCGGDTVMAEPILDYATVSVADWNEAQIKEEQVIMLFCLILIKLSLFAKIIQQENQGFKVHCS